MGWQGEEAAMHVIGVDVSKAKLDCAVIVQVEPMKRRQKVVSNDPQGWAKLLEWACQNAGCEAGELKLVLEPTSSYHEGVAHYAHDRGARVWIINPKQMRDFAKGLGVRSKTDALDCSVLAQFGLKAQAMDWMPAPLPLRELQSLLRRLEDLQQTLQAELNRVEAAQARQAPALVMDSLHSSVSFLEQQIKRLNAQIDQHIDGHPQLKADYELLRSIPAVGPSSARVMLVQLRGRVFDSAAQASGFLGLRPVHWESGSSVHKLPRLGPHGDRLARRILYMAALTAKRNNPDARALYERLVAAGKRPMLALCAVMRKLVHICFGVLKHQRPYVPQIAASA
jgi:transposase